MIYQLLLRRQHDVCRLKPLYMMRNTSLIREAILREILRGGQVYFLHNEVDTIEKTARELEALVPEARIQVCTWSNA